MAPPTMVVTERFTRTADDSILYQFTVNDPENYMQPWSGELPMMATAKSFTSMLLSRGVITRCRAF